MATAARLLHRGAFKQPGKLFIQQPNGAFTGKDLVTGVKYEEDMQTFSSTPTATKTRISSSSAAAPNSIFSAPYYRPGSISTTGKAISISTACLPSGCPHRRKAWPSPIRR